MKHLLLILAMLLATNGLQAQKVDQRLKRLVEQTAQRRAQGLKVDNENVKRQFAVELDADGNIQTLGVQAYMKEGAECPTERLEKMGIRVIFTVGNMAGLAVPADKLGLLETIDEISFVWADEMNQYFNDAARVETGVDQIVNDGASVGLPSNYTGKGVVLGIIDGGIDFNHAAFCQADGTTRVKKVIIYEDLYGKVTEYTTDEAIKALTTDETSSSHGTHTAATAGGSDTGNGLQGVAPEADLVLVGLRSYAADTNMADAIQRISDFAGDRPCVISVSLGSINRLHDGSSALAQKVKELTQSGTKAGRAVVVASGNNADMQQSIVKTLNKNQEVKTVLGATTMTPVYMDLNLFVYSDKEFNYKLKKINIKTGEEADITSLVTDEGTPSDFELVQENYQSMGKKWCMLNSTATTKTIKLDNPDQRLMLSIQALADDMTIKIIRRVDDGEEPALMAPSGLEGMTAGNGDIALSAHVCEDAVIGVGAYITKTTWDTYQDGVKSYSKSVVTGVEQVVGEIADFSSYGVDDNGKNRPDVIAPGMATFSAVNNYDTEMFLSPGDPNTRKDLGELLNVSYMIEKNGRKNWYGRMQGTSMSTPHVAGIIALWMQAKPTLTVNEIKEVLKATCHPVTDTNMIPSRNPVQAGMGKIDAIKGLKKVLETSGIDEIEVGGHRQATPATMFDVDASVYNLRGERVDKATKGLVIYKGRVYINK